jgi:hypothetical protein
MEINPEKQCAFQPFDGQTKQKEDFFDFFEKKTCIFTWFMV